MPKRRATTAEILAQIPAARRAEAEAYAAGRRAVGAWYDAAAGRIMIELSNGSIFGFLTGRIAAIAGLSPQALARVTVNPGGSGLYWEHEDIDLSVAGLILDTVDHTEKRRELARIAGKTRSSAKAAASRANGKKGGRPRKKAAADHGRSKTA